jgi:Fe-S cluster biosynthesis and repair protein YggX
MQRKITTMVINNAQLSEKNPAERRLTLDNRVFLKQTSLFQK